MPDRTGPIVGRGTAWTRFLSALRRIAGMPDYQAYVEHLRTCHPELPVPSEQEFYTEYTEARYGSGTSRCC